jgi:phage-related protein
MKVIYLETVSNIIRKLEPNDSGRIYRTKVLFEDYGFQIGPKYIKKIKANLWELRAGRFRVFLCIKGRIAYGVHILHKKSQKIPKKDIKLATFKCKNL